jgi:glutamate-1-semialdehyde 2,1-aminomutase
MVVSGAHPYFFERGDGCRVWDVDGNEYIDLMCSYGPIVIGHRHPAVEAAVRDQLQRGDCFNAPTRLWVELAERLVEMTPFADWAAFAKNGSDVCTWAVAVAREHTGRRKVVKAEGAYHGAHAWCTPAAAGVTAEDTANVRTFTYNDLQSVRAVVDGLNDDVAASTSPFRHDAFHDQEPPVEGFPAGVRACDARGTCSCSTTSAPAIASTSAAPGALRRAARLACYAKAL